MTDFTPRLPTDTPATAPNFSPIPTPRPTLTPEASPSPTAELTCVLEDLHEARYYRQLDDNRVPCQMCFRRCVVPEGAQGFCRNKVNIGGRYYTLVYGHPSALQIDAIEKEPCFHMPPGGNVFCTCTASCNNRCKFCRNWHLSQRSFEEISHMAITPEETVAYAIGFDAASFTYNEPSVFYEHMFDVAKLTKEAGMGALCHTNEGMNEEPLAALLA